MRASPTCRSVVIPLWTGSALKRFVLLGLSGSARFYQLGAKSARGYAGKEQGNRSFLSAERRPRASRSYDHRAANKRGAASRGGRCWVTTGQKPRQERVSFHELVCRGWGENRLRASGSLMDESNCHSEQDVMSLETKYCSTTQSTIRIGCAYYPFKHCKSRIICELVDMGTVFQRSLAAIGLCTS